MINVENVKKSFDSTIALNDFSLHVKKGSIYGLVGTNGSGKTTIIKHLVGTFVADSGIITVDGENVYDNISIKEKIGYIPDDLSHYAHSELKYWAKYYGLMYPSWNSERFNEMLKIFELPDNRKLSKFSKGMQKQAIFSLVMATMPKYLILDEPIDGLDPIVRKLIWKYIVTDVAEREMTVLVSSHNLREMEGICDSIGIVDHGKMVLERDLDELKSDIHKVQVALNSPSDSAMSKLNILHREKRGTVDLLIVRNNKTLVDEVINEQSPILYDLLPLSLEEIFIYELGGELDEIANIF